ncbi:MAG: ribulose-phosphate 3-epimerase [Oscillospiraceae bacterium]|jgi:ribulose-phosphate 3-epimerase|nr:ribulose-phosphate 3-epimerase [Oscillospiraceae bacterium]
MAHIAPSILSADFTKLGEELRRLSCMGVKYVHIDIMDGNFVPNITFGYNMVSALAPLKGDMIFDVHLMINNPHFYIEQFAKAGSDFITVHIEACEDVPQCLSLIRESGKLAGVSIKPNTAASELAPYLGMFDLCLVMTVEPGFGGQSMIEPCLSKIEEIKSMLRERDLPDILYSVDGGVTLENAAKTAQSGADIIVAGNALYSSADMEKRFAELSEKVKEK